MVNRGIWYVAGIALIALAGCARTRRLAAPPGRRSRMCVRPPANDLVGTWKGSFVPSVR